MQKDIVLFYYYSSPPVPEKCFLSLREDIAYRNMFLLKCPDSLIHFEFPMFEDHSYNTICNRKGLRSLIQRPNHHEKYIIFKTCDADVIGFYKVLKAYYQESKMFNNYGFVWGIEAYPHLIEKGVIKYQGPRIPRGYRSSWSVNAKSDWNKILNELLFQIQKEKNISDIYQSETNRLLGIFRDPKMEEWKDSCKVCATQSKCALFREFKKYAEANPDSNMFSVINNIYSGNLYSRNILNRVPKIYLK